MKGRAGGGKGGGGTAPTDLLVCFPARPHLALMPKPICSPSRTMEKAVRKRLPAHPTSSNNRRRASPLFKGSKAKHVDSDVDEPQSPKVTCAGQIKVRSKPRSKPSRPDGDGGGGGGGGSKSWLSVVEEIERLHEQRKKDSWLETIGFKKDCLPFLGGALRSLRLKMQCFGSFHGAVDCSTDEEDGEEDGEDGNAEEKEGKSSSSATVFSKWFMVLEENQSTGCKKEEQEAEGDEEEEQTEENDESSKPSSVPPSNALLLMRCRSAPAKGLLKREAGEHPGEEQEMSAKVLKGEDNKEEEEKSVFMSSAPDFLKLSMDIAKETWLVGGGGDPFARSRSWKR